jgi:hypothetical protein
MKTAPCLTVLASLVLLSSPARAQIEWISGPVAVSDFRKTTLPFAQGRTAEYILKGWNLDATKKVEGLPAGATLVKLAGQFGFPPQVTLGLSLLATTAPGVRTLTLRKAPGWGQTVGDIIDRLDIIVVRQGLFDMTAPTLSSYFTEAGFRVRGSQLNAATVLAEGWPQGTTVTVDPNSAGDFAIVRLRFPTQLAEASGDILFHDKAMPGFCRNRPSDYFYHITGSSSIRKRLRVLGPNAVKSIGFIGGRNFGWAQEITARLTFVKPVATGETVFWRIANIDTSQPILAEGLSPVTADPAAQTVQTSPGTGSGSTDIRFRVCGCSGMAHTLKLRTWYGSTSATGPGYKEESFTVSCPAGGRSSCQ